MDTTEMTESPGRQCQKAEFKVFPSWDTALCIDQAPPNLDSRGHKAERNLVIEMCIDGYDDDQFKTKAEVVIRKLQKRWFEQKLESHFPFDEVDVNARRWELCMVYFEALAQGCREQSKEQLNKLIYENHMHNAQRRHDFLIQRLKINQLKVAKKGSVINPEYWMSQRYDLDLDLAKIQGEYLGRELVDKLRPKPEPLPLPLAPGDICITLSPRKHCTDTSLITETMPEPKHPQTSITGIWWYQSYTKFKKPSTKTN
jgi:hypothetical protein